MKAPEKERTGVYAAMPQQVNILMVDDQPAKLLTYEVMLAELGENLLKATSAREALEILLKNDVAVVLLGGSMPAILGFLMAEKIPPPPPLPRTAINFLFPLHPPPPYPP